MGFRSEEEARVHRICALEAELEEREREIAVLRARIEERRTIAREQGAEEESEGEVVYEPAAHPKGPRRVRPSGS